MNRLSTKATVYLIDGCNLIRSAWDQNPFFNFAEAEAEFFEWLENVCNIDDLSSSTFRIIMDGGYRPIKHRLSPAVNIVFTDDGNADDWIVERAYYFKSKNIRTVAISSDRELSERLKADGINCVPCKKFISICNKAIRMTYGI
ncbi:MAG: NYN domain-containing protein [Elusimicrobia bacterium]|nr:NYN domain-containing protein [Elusimicrobiota bacterium]